MSRSSGRGYRRHFTPGIRKDVDAMTRTNETFRRSPFIAIHVRRGDKLRTKFHDIKHGVKVNSNGTICGEEFTAWATTT